MPYVETAALVRWLDRAFMLGREAPSDHVQDWSLERAEGDDRPAMRSRKIVVVDVGDAPDLALRRIGPDGAAWDCPREAFVAVTPGSNLGTIYWQGWDGDGFGVRQAQVYARQQSGGGGSLHLATTPVGGTEPVDRVSIGADGLIDLGDVPLDTDDQGVFLVLRVHGKRARVRLEIIG